MYVYTHSFLLMKTVDNSWDLLQKKSKDLFPQSNDEVVETAAVSKPEDFWKPPTKPLPFSTGANGITVHYLDGDQLSNPDAFAAGWWQRREDFLTMNLTAIRICEDAAFRAFMDRDRRRHMLRMTVDWLNFGVEHLSKWWKLTEALTNELPFENLIKKLEDYVVLGNTADPPAPAMSRTVALIAYQPQSPKGGSEERAKKITIVALAATIESLRRAGMGRVVVVGSDDKYRGLVKETFAYLRAKVPGAPSPMELAYATAPQDSLKTQFLEYNIPRGALMGLKRAMTTTNNDKESFPWLGDHKIDYWTHVYLTEPDTLLFTRPASMDAMLNEVNKGMVLVPHRVQPLPHESDVHGYSKKHAFVPAEGNFAHVLSVDPSTHACCDDLKGPEFKPGAPPTAKGCLKPWYMCGFDKYRNHERLEPYTLLRLSRGSNLVLLSATNHGRRCTPRLGDTCAVPQFE